MRRSLRSSSSKYARGGTNPRFKPYGPELDDLLDVVGSPADAFLELLDCEATRNHTLQQTGPALRPTLQVIDARLKVASVRVNGPEDHFIPEHDL
jgi:hypothetical protein